MQKVAHILEVDCGLGAFANESSGLFGIAGIVSNNSGRLGYANSTDILRAHISYWKALH